MNILDIFVLAIALSLDAMIVSFSYGFSVNSKKLKISIILAFAFGFFQFLMPLIGWHLTSYIYNYLKSFSKWIVFAIFLYLAIKFLQSAFSEEKDKKNEYISVLCVFSLAIATSIDALGAGISLKFTYNSIFIPSILIGLTTLILSFIGFWSAYFIRKIPKKYIEIVGAILFIYLAISTII